MEGRMKKILSTVVFLFMLLMCGRVTSAQPAIGGPDQCDVVIKVNGQSEVVTIVKDAFRDDQWYYVPSKPRLALTSDKEPVFSLLKYQIRTAAKGKGEGAILQFAVNMALPPESVDELDKLLKKVVPANIARNLKISPLPMSDVKISLLHGKTGELIAECDKPAELTSSFANSEIPFQLNLTGFGADVYDDLCSGNTGVGVWVAYKYSGVTLPATLKITADMDQVYNHVSHDIKLKTEIAKEGLGLGGQVNHQMVRDQLTQVKGLKLQSVSGEAWPENKMAEVENRILDFLYSELFDKEKTRITEADPAAAKEAELPCGDTVGQVVGKSGGSSGTASQASDAGDQVGKAAGGIVNGLVRGGLAVATLGVSELVSPAKWRLGISAAMKDVKKVRKGKYEISMEKRAIKQVQGGCGSFIGIGPFLKRNPKMKDKLIRTLSSGGWEYATFALPSPADAAELGVIQVDMTVSILDEAGKQIQPEGAAQSAIWRSGAQNLETWTSADGQAITALNFPLMSLAAKYKDKGGLEKLKFQVKTQIIYKTQGAPGTIRFSRLEPVMNGDIPFAPPYADFETLKINADSINFQDDVRGLSIQLTAKDGTTYKASVSKSTPEEKKSPVFLFTRSTADKPNPVKAKIVFMLKNGKAFESNYNKLEDIMAEGPEIWLFPEWTEE